VRVVATLPYDASRRQLFLPQQLLEQHGGDVEDVFAGRQTPPLRGAVDQLLVQARLHLDTATGLLASVEGEVRPAFLPLAIVKRDLAKLSRADNDPFVPYAPPRLSTLWTLWRASRSKLFS
jgi:phytoene synthase